MSWCLILLCFILIQRSFWWMLFVFICSLKSFAFKKYFSFEKIIKMMIDLWYQSHTPLWFKNTCRACSLKIHRLDFYEYLLFILNRSLIFFDFLKCQFENGSQPNCYKSLSFTPNSWRLWIRRSSGLSEWSLLKLCFCLDWNSLQQSRDLPRRSPILHMPSKVFHYSLHHLQ